MKYDKRDKQGKAAFNEQRITDILTSYGDNDTMYLSTIWVFFFTLNMIFIKCRTLDFTKNGR
jgi:hypothetical protein